MAFMRNHTQLPYPTLESRISIGIKKSVQTLCFFLKDAELAVKSSLLMEPKQSAQQ
jgi:hypothetical protein